MPNDQEILGRGLAESGVTPTATAEAALAGLLAPRKTLPPSLFYDETGCRLFYEITKLPEYYLTRTESALLATTAPEVAAMLPVGTTLVEYGASDETKAEMLLRQTARQDTARPATESQDTARHDTARQDTARQDTARQDTARQDTARHDTGRQAGEARLARAAAKVFRVYIPIDVAAPELRAMHQRMAERHADLRVLPVVADFMRPVVLPALTNEAAIMGFFPGSTIGNLEPAAAVAFLHRARDTLGRGARFLLGFDTCRDPARLIPAYDDPGGVTARFNLNLLIRLNREANANFDPGGFEHRAVWNPDESRVEMHLVAREACLVTIAGQEVHFAKNETIHTENSYKYQPARMRDMIAEAGWSIVKKWSDSNGLFALWLLD